MSQAEMLKEFKQLSIFQQLDILKNAVQIIEQHIQSYIHKPADMIKPESEMSLAEAAQILLKDYEEDEELTAFTALDGDDFYVEG